MSKHDRRLARLAPAVSQALEVLKDAIQNFGDEIGAALAAQAEQQTAEQEKRLERERLTTEEPDTKEPTTVDGTSATVCYRAKATAQRLCIHEQTLYRWVKEGRFPPGTRIGPGRVIWTEATIAQWLDEQRANPGKRRPLPSDRLKRERLGRE